ncbi:MAG TPA: homoserine dehydrogenase [Acidimicrobiia bacterium]|nr:homoserine dehydrogenase [Acidimicrobiia bacterium]
MTESTVRVGMLGCGNVGSAVVRLIHDHADILTPRAGRKIEVARVAVRDLSKERDVPLGADAFTADLESVVTDPDIDVIVEVMGAIEPARTHIRQALEAGKPVVSANKELLANCGRELIDAAEAAGVDLLFEAAVAGGIPLIRPLRESLAGERIQRVLGIVNGTTNYILTRMTEDGWTFDEALVEAQRLGYAEPDPTADVEGYDAAAKAAIIASIAFGAEVRASDVYREGLTGVTVEDIQAARDLGYVVKLLAIADTEGSRVSARVHPAFVPADHPLAAVRESFNAVFIEGAAVGELMLYGPGAGPGPTASAVLGDLIDAVRNLSSGGPGAKVGHWDRREILPIDDVESQFYVHLEVADRPGVLATIAGFFGNHDVSIMSVQQRGRGDKAELIFVTHTARNADLFATIDDIRDFDAVRRVGSVLRVVGEDPA